MKLNPPASSSDLDTARAIARRLHQRATAQEAGVPEKAEPSEAARPATAPPTVVNQYPEAEPYPEPAPPPEPRPPLEPPAPVDPYPEPDEDELELSTDEETEAEEPARASLPTGPVETPMAGAEPDELEVASDEEEDEEFDPAEASASQAFQPGPFEISVPGLDDDEGDEPLAEESSRFDEEPPPDEKTAPGVSLHPEEKTAPGRSTPQEPFPLSEPAPPAGSTTDATELEHDSEAPALGDDALSALTEDAPGGPVEDLGPPAGPVSPEDLVSGWGDDAFAGEPQSLEPEPAPDNASPPPSWDDLADSCMFAARAHGAMIVDPAGQVVTARGQWPEPGPEAIGRRLVAMMEKTLAGAPTRSVSAPLAGEHLTAWRVPVAEGFLTVVFMAETTLDNEARGNVDEEIHRTLGQ